MSKRDYYDVLGVPKTSSADEIKKAYKRLAMKYHPDRNPSDTSAESKFKELSEAYEVLSDQDKRSDYDTFGHNGPTRSSTRPPWSDHIDDIFKNHFNQDPHRGRDLSTNVTITLAEVITGTEKQVQVPIQFKCEPCKGSGSADGNADVCSECGGNGIIQMRQGPMIMHQVCGVCRGKGRIISKPCSTCHGEGVQSTTKTLKAKIPPGISTGNRVRFAGAINQPEGPPTDLYVQVQVKPDPTFMQDGNNLVCKVTVDFTLAALGGSVQVPTMEGEVTLKVPPGTQPQQILRIKNKGVPIRGSSQRGDLLYVIFIKTPTNLTEQQKSLLEDYKNTLEGDHIYHSVDTWM